MAALTQPCPRCNGTGRYPKDPEWLCYGCNGSGRDESPESATARDGRLAHERELARVGPETEQGQALLATWHAEAKKQRAAAK